MAISVFYPEHDPRAADAPSPVVTRPPSVPGVPQIPIYSASGRTAMPVYRVADIQARRHWRFAFIDSAVLGLPVALATAVAIELVGYEYAFILCVVGVVVALSVRLSRAARGFAAAGIATLVTAVSVYFSLLAVYAGRIAYEEGGTWVDIAPAYFRDPFAAHQAVAGAGYPALIGSVLALVFAAVLAGLVDTDL
jgi:hypothetical protein